MVKIIAVVAFTVGFVIGIMVMQGKYNNLYQQYQSLGAEYAVHKLNCK